ncbi:hypothetical protein GCM10009745_69870 [Kribbella yunnanensis]|uniref:Uncharacterized protein n=1 Tax=Kribbella yunnanensis TaxID=190194 RepID=A0ABP4UU91_9ACTN
MSNRQPERVRTSYDELPGFASYVLEESYVLGVIAEPGVVRFRLEVVLTPEHPAYEEPGSGVYLCYRPGELRFDGVTELDWAGQGASPATDASGEVDYGHVDTMTLENGVYALAGDWGSMRVRAASARVAIDD